MKHSYFAHTIGIICCSCLLFSCGIDSSSLGDTKKDTQTYSIPSGSGADTHKSSHDADMDIGDTKAERIGYQSFRLSGKTGKKLEKIEIVWKNGTSTDSYVLKSFQSDSQEFTSYLRVYLGNLSVGKNEYTIRGYVGDTMVVEKHYELDFQKTGCEFISEKIINFNDSGYTQKEIDADPRMKKYNNKLRKFSIYVPQELCHPNQKDPEHIVLNDGLKIRKPMDMIDFVGGFERQNKILKEEGFMNGNGLKSNIAAVIGFRCNTPSCDFPTHPTPEDDIRYEIIGGPDSLQFRINEGVTKDNWKGVYDTLKTIIQTTEELPLEIPKFNYQQVTVDFNDLDNSITLVDDKGLIKKINVTGVKLQDMCQSSGSCDFEKYQAKTNSIIWSYSEQHQGVGISIQYETSLLNGETREIGNKTWGE